MFALPAKTESYEVRPLTLVYRDAPGPKDTYGGAVGWVALGGLHYVPVAPSDTVLISMHPIGGTGRLPVMARLAEAGLHVIGADSRYRGRDDALIMENCVLDLGAVVRHAKEALGYERVVLLGWSGGGSLSAFYQAEAEDPRVTGAPGGGGPDLTKAALIPADGVVFMAAHVSRHGTLSEWIDPAIRDEADPTDRDPKLDIYSGAHGPPFSDEFIARYRAAQVARNRRITDWVKAELARVPGGQDRAFTVHGTMADPRFLDPALDPNGREAGRCYLGDPEVVNMSPIGLARHSSLRSWLSQWSLDDANGDGPRCAARISVPVLVIDNGADDACTPSHARRLFDAVAHDDVELHTVEGATHYYQGQPEQAAEAVRLVRDWTERKELVEAGAVKVAGQEAP